MKKLKDIIEFKNAVGRAEEEYSYQPLLTQKLDSYSEDFSEITLLEIVLWKTNRYPTLTKDLITDINDLRKNYSNEKAKDLLRKLLGLKGFDLPMASTVLRFAVPNHLQIIDQRVYRFITPDENSLNIPYNLEKKIELYFNYMERLKKISEDYDIPFSKSDRILYQMDKIYNKNISLKTST